jgi:hypothetical protein
VELRVASSPEDWAPHPPVLGGAQLAELVAAPDVVPHPAGLFTVRAALGKDVLKAGKPNHLYLRVRNTGTAPSTKTRLRLYRLVVAADVKAVEVAAATPDVPAGGVHVEDFTWDPGGTAPRTELILVVADDDRDGRRLADPATFPDLAAVHAFAARRPGVALRLFDVV